MEIKYILKKFNFSPEKPRVNRLNIPFYGEEPMRRNRYILDITLNDRQYTCFVNSETPRMSTDWTGMRFNNMRAQILPRIEWRPIQVRLRDIVNRDLESFKDDLRTSYMRNMTSRQPMYKSNATLQMIDPTGVVVESWILVNCFISQISIDYEPIYGGSQPVYEFTLNYDHCVHNF